MRLRILHRRHAKFFGENTPQVTIRHAYFLGDERQINIIGHIIFNHACSSARQFRTRLRRGKARCQLGPTTQARAKPGCLRRGRTRMKGAIFLLRQPHPTNRSTINMGRRNADKKASVKARVVRFHGVIAGGSVEMHGLSLSARHMLH